MAAGHTHDRITIICLPLLAAATFGITQSITSTTWVASSFLFSGLMFGPDLDIHSKQSMRWGWLQWLWWPYRRWIRHRSLLSHGPIIGTVLRILYALCWLAIFAVIVHSMARLSGRAVGDLSQLVAQIRTIVDRHHPQAIAMFSGLELGAMSHYVADLVSSSLKQWRQRLTSSPALVSKKRKKQSKTNRAR